MTDVIEFAAREDVFGDRLFLGAHALRDETHFRLMRTARDGVVQEDAVVIQEGATFAM